MNSVITKHGFRHAPRRVLCCAVTSLESDTTDAIYTASLLRDPFHRDFCEFEVLCSQCNLSACTENFVDDYGFAYVSQLPKLTETNVMDI